MTIFGLDDQGLPCYLETMKEENLAFYASHGFEVAAEEMVRGRAALLGAGPAAAVAGLDRVFDCQ